MRFTRKWGVILLSVFLILYGLGYFIDLHFRGFAEVLAILAIAAGVLLLIDR